MHNLLAATSKFN